MMNTPRILHIIDSISTGGAEVLLKNTISLLPGCSHMVAYLRAPDYEAVITEKDAKLVRLQYHGWRDMLSAAGQLRRLIREFKPLLVHSHLYESTLCARLAVNRTPLFTTIHSIYSMDAFRNSRAALWAEKLTVRDHQVLIAVSATALDDYLSVIPFRGKRYVLYNFLPDNHFMQKDPSTEVDQLRCVAVGNLKPAKNYNYLLDIFSHLNKKGITLDIYGEGSMRGELEQRIENENLPVTLRGSTPDIHSMLRDYDLFIQASDHEGFGISVIEAMAAGLPAFLSDIPVFREITGGNAFFFPLDESAEAAARLESLCPDHEERNLMASAAFGIASERYKAGLYRRKLIEIYRAGLNRVNIAADIAGLEIEESHLY